MKAKRTLSLFATLMVLGGFGSDGLGASRFVLRAG